MKFIQNLNRTALALAAATTLGLSASACSNNDPTVPDGDYLGVAVYGSDVSNGYVYMSVTVADGAVTGSAEVYDFPSCPAGAPTACAVSASVPDGDTTTTITGTVDGTTLNITLTDAEASVVATLGADGTLSSDLIPDNPESGFESYGMIYPDNGSETGIACGGFGFSVIPPAAFTGTEGGAAFLATEDGRVFGVVASSDFTGLLDGTYDDGGVCAGDSSCNNGITGTLTGTLSNGTAVSFDITPAMSDLDFVTAADTTTITYLSMGADMANDDYSGGFGGSSSSCTGAP